VKLGLQIPDFTQPGGPTTLGADLAAVARAADDAGFDILAVMDHLFQIPMVGPPERDMLEAYTTLSFLAAHTSRARLLALISGVSLRHPGVLLKQVSTIDVLSGGRAMLGIGAGWYEEEAVSLGVPFAPVGVRFEQLEEQLQIAHRMFSGSEEPFAGKHYRLERPLNHPAPLRRPPIMVGGSGERKTLRLVARYGDACNLYAGPDVARKLDVLREHCAAETRDYDSIEKTGLLAFDLSNGPNALVDQLGPIAEAGLQTVIGFVPDLWGGKSLDLLARDVIPQVASL
jgi:F420-dependent oxidoreductase-like protein